MTKDEAMKLALEALEVSTDWDMNATGKQAQSMKAITVLRRALAEQPAQQEKGDSICQEDDGCPTELAVLQRFWRGQSIPYEHYPTWCKPAPVPEPCKHEPVDSDEKAGAYMEARLWEFIDMAAAWPKASPDPRTWNHVVVYAPTPPQRTWVGLTPEEILDLFDLNNVYGSKWVEFARTVEAKLKERNT